MNKNRTHIRLIPMFENVPSTRSSRGTHYKPPETDYISWCPDLSSYLLKEIGTLTDSLLGKFCETIRIL